jgi:hypothetical protein
MFSYNYTNSRNNTFLSEDRNAGVCKNSGEASDECCEVPIGVSGNYLADTQGHWNTDSGFSYLSQIYGVILSGYSADTYQYSRLMSTIQSQVEYLGLTKGSQRDYSWNIIAWASYTYIATGFQFFTSANIGKMFNKPLAAAGLNGQAGTCNIPVSPTYQLSSRTVSIEFDMDTGKNCDYDTGCTNPCPNVLSPQGMGYDPQTASFYGYTVTVDMAAITTAIAVNQGIISVNVLQNFSDDSDRMTLLGQMESKKYISKATYDATFSYYSKCF